MTAYFGFENLIPLGTVTAQDSEGFEKENAYDWFTYTLWLSPESDSAIFQINFDEYQSIDYFGVASHNMATIGGSVTLQYFDSLDWVTVGSTVNPLNNAPIFQKFTEITAMQFRFVFADYVGESPYIGILSIGESLVLPVGIEAPFTPPPFYFDNKVFNSQSSKGQFLGRSVERYAQKCLINQKNIDPQWMLDNWQKVIEYLENQAFFYSWNYEEYPQDAVYAWLDGNLPVAKFNSPIHAGFDIKCRAIYDPKWF